MAEDKKKEAPKPKERKQYQCTVCNNPSCKGGHIGIDV